MRHGGSCGLCVRGAGKQPAYDAKKISGFAFGMGVERIAMMKYGISEIGQLYSGDMRFLEQFRAMNILSQWIRSYVPGMTMGGPQLADDLTLRGIAVEGIFDLGPGNGSLFEMDITTNRVDAMNHYGIAREAAATGGAGPARRSTVSLPAFAPVTVPFSVRIEAPELCGRFTARVAAAKCASGHRPG